MACWLAIGPRHNECALSPSPPYSHRKPAKHYHRLISEESDYNEEAAEHSNRKIGHAHGRWLWLSTHYTPHCPTITPAASTAHYATGHQATSRPSVIRYLTHPAPCPCGNQRMIGMRCRLLKMGAVPAARVLRCEAERRVGRQPGDMGVGRAGLPPRRPRRPAQGCMLRGARCDLYYKYPVTSTPYRRSNQLRSAANASLPPQSAVSSQYTPRRQTFEQSENCGKGGGGGVPVLCVSLSLLWGFMDGQTTPRNKCPA